MFQDHFSGHAEGDARHRPGYPAALFTWLAQSAPARGWAWDCATGNGQAARGLAAHFSRVVATDGSRRQIAQARPHPRIRFGVALAEHAPLAEASMDLVTVAQALHWFQRPAFWNEARRVLRPGGVLAVWTYGLPAVCPAVDAVIRHLYGELLADFWPPERRLVEGGYRDIGFPFPELPAPAFRLAAHWTLAQLLGYLSTWSAVHRCRRATGDDPLAAIAGPLAQAWGPAGRRRGIRWPLVLRAGARP